VRAGGPTSVSVYDGKPSSGAAVLPSDTAPAASSTCVTSLLTSGTYLCSPANAREPKPVGTPARSVRSLSASGSPPSTPSVGSTSAARARARSGVTVTKAPRSVSRSAIRRR
jgi:hypothetical protein